MQENSCSNWHSMYAGIMQQEKHFPLKGHSSWRRLFQAGNFWVHCGPSIFVHLRNFFTYNKKKRSQNDAILKVLLMIKKFFGVWDLEVETFQCFTKLSVFSVLYLFQREAEVTRNSVEVIKYSPATHEASCTSSKIPLLYHSTFPCQQTARRPSQIFQVQFSFLPNILQQ